MHENGSIAARLLAKRTAGFVDEIISVAKLAALNRESSYADRARASALVEHLKRLKDGVIASDPLPRMLLAGPGTYVFCRNGPIIFIDADGNWSAWGWIGSGLTAVGGVIVGVSTAPVWGTVGVACVVVGGVIVVADLWSSPPQEEAQEVFEVLTSPSSSGAPTPGSVFVDSDGDDVPDVLDDFPHDRCRH